MLQLLQLTQTIYWAGLATWFGAALFIAIAAPVIFRVVREADPTLPLVLSVNLDHQHSTLLASTIVARLMQAVTRVALGCAAAVFVGLVAQQFILPARAGPNLIGMGARALLFFLALIVLVYDWRLVSPRLLGARQRYIDHADEPDVANEAKDLFERYSRESLNVLFLQVLFLLGLILFSSTL